MEPTFPISSTHTIYIPTFATTTNPTKQIELGWKLRQYMNNHFSPTPGKDRNITLMQRAVFEMLCKLRNQNLREEPVDIKLEIVDEATSLDFKWLHPLEFRKTRASCFLRVENSSSKERGYLLDIEQYQLFKPDWDAAIDSDSKGFRTFVLVYNPNILKILPPEPSTKGDNSHEFEFVKGRTEEFSIPKYQKEDFNFYQFVKPLHENFLLLNPQTTDRQQTRYELMRNRELRYYLRTRAPMPRKLYRYIYSLIIVVSDMTKFVGFEEPIRFQGNYKTNQSNFCIRNTDRITYHTLRTKGKDIHSGAFLQNKRQQAEKLLYTTKVDYDNMLVFINFCELGKMVIHKGQQTYQGQQIDHDARLKMLEVIDLSTQQTVKESRERLRHMDLSQFGDILIHYHHHFGQFQICRQNVKQFIERCMKNTSPQRQCIESLMRMCKGQDLTVAKQEIKLSLRDLDWSALQYRHFDNEIQYIILTEMWRVVIGEGQKEGEQKYTPSK